MERFKNLQAVEGVGTLEQDAEGMVTLNEEQLDAVDNALANTNSIIQERDNLQNQVAERDNTIAERDTTIAQLENRVSELEEQLQNPEGAEKPANAYANNKEDDDSPMSTCLEHIKNFS